MSPSSTSDFRRKQVSPVRSWLFITSVFAVAAFAAWALFVAGVMVFTGERTPCYHLPRAPTAHHARPAAMAAVAVPSMAPDAGASPSTAGAPEHDVCDFGSVYGSMEECFGIEVVPMPRPATKKPGQDAAVDLVWRKLYEMTIDPPVIEWVEGDKLNCGEGRAFDGKLVGGKGTIGKARYHGWLEADAGNGGFPPCVYGTFEPATNVIQLAWPPGSKRFSTTALAHELAHARAFRLNGEVSYAHAGFDFAPHGRAAQADAVLRRHGL